MKLVFRKKLLIEKLGIDLAPSWADDCDGLEVKNLKVVGTGICINGKNYEYSVPPEWCEYVEE